MYFYSPFTSNTNGFYSTFLKILQSPALLFQMVQFSPTEEILWQTKLFIFYIIVPQVITCFFFFPETRLA